MSGLTVVSIVASRSCSSRPPEHRLGGCSARRRSCCADRGIFLDQAWNLCLLCWQADSLPRPGMEAPELRLSGGGDLDGFSVLRTLPCFRRTAGSLKGPQLTSSWARLESGSARVIRDGCPSCLQPQGNSVSAAASQKRIELMVKTVSALPCPSHRPIK